MADTQPNNAPSQGDSDPLGGVKSALTEAALQADTFARNAANTVTFGLADNADAALGATLGMGGAGDWGQRYQNELNQETQRNVYDSINRGIAKGAGKAAGVILPTLDGAAAGYGWADGLPSVAKGDLGEALSEAKAWLSGNPVVGRQVTQKLSRGYTKLDLVLKDGKNIEAKFGGQPLRPQQRLAQVELAPNYHVERWGPSLFGYAGGAAAGLAGIFGAAHNNQQQQSNPPRPTGGQ